MNRKNVGKVLRAFARLRPGEWSNLPQLVIDTTEAEGLGLTRSELANLYVLGPAREWQMDRAASAWVIAHLYETGVVDWPLAVARAGLKVAA